MCAIKDVKDILEIAQGVVTIGAIVLGGIWTYLAFVRKHLRYPRAELSVTVHSSLIPPRFRLVHVGLRISNSGDVLLAPQYAELRLRRVKPLSTEIQARLQPNIDPVAEGETVLEWPLIVGREWKWEAKDVEIEPGESDLLDADFVIDDTVEEIQLYAFVRNPKKRRDPLGWTITLMHTFKTGAYSMADYDKERTDLNEKQQRQQQQQRQEQDRRQEQWQQQQQQQSRESSERDKED